jgi:hypothetical protein
LVFVDIVAIAIAIESAFADVEVHSLRFLISFGFILYGHAVSFCSYFLRKRCQLHIFMAIEILSRVVMVDLDGGPSCAEIARGAEVPMEGLVFVSGSGIGVVEGLPLKIYGLSLVAGDDSVGSSSEVFGDLEIDGTSGSGSVRQFTILVA